MALLRFFRDARAGSIPALPRNPRRRRCIRVRLIIWSTDLQARDPVRASVASADDRSVNNVVTALALARMSTAEIQRALESLADFAADRMVNELAEALDDVRG